MFLILGGLKTGDFCSEFVKRKLLSLTVVFKEPPHSCFGLSAMVAEILKCVFLSCHSGAVMEVLVSNMRRNEDTYVSVCVCLFTCAWECVTRMCMRWYADRSLCISGTIMRVYGDKSLE